MWVKGMNDLLAVVTIVQPIHDLIHGSRLVKKDALDYLRQEGIYRHAPFPPPEWITETLCAMTGEELERLMSCKNKLQAYKFLHDHRHSRLYKEEPPRRGGRHVRDEVHQERLRLAPNMTPKQFAAYFKITLQAAYAWDDNNGFLLKRRLLGRRKGQ